MNEIEEIVAKGYNALINFNDIDIKPYSDGTKSLTIDVDDENNEKKEEHKLRKKSKLLKEFCKSAKNLGNTERMKDKQNKMEIIIRKHTNKNARKNQGNTC